MWGIPNPPEGTITGNVGRSIKDRKIMQVFKDEEEGKTAITHYKILEDLGYISLVECKLETGRTHQIRVHFSHIKHPLFNDEEYGGDQIIKGTTFTKYQQFIKNCFKILPRQALHAKSLAFDHPVTGKRLSFDSDLPDDMVQVIEKWRKYISGRDIIMSKIDSVLDVDALSLVYSYQLPPAPPPPKLPPPKPPNRRPLRCFHLKIHPSYHCVNLCLNSSYS